jgi:hypothetical protein
MRAFCGILAGLSVLSWSAAALAATVKPSGGSVSINSGRPVTGETQVKLGDTVTAGPRASAKIIYANGCSVTVEPGTTVSITHDDHCTLGLAGPSAGGLGGLGGLGTVAIGAAVVAGGIGLAAALKKPASP